MPAADPRYTVRHRLYQGGPDRDSRRLRLRQHGTAAQVLSLDSMRPGGVWAAPNRSGTTWH